MKHFIQDIKDHVASNLAEVYHERCGHEPITQYEVFREYIRVTVEHVRYLGGGLVCHYFGHSKDVEVDDQVYCERDVRGRITDIDGGRVNWWCPRCGMGGSSWF